MSLSGSIEVFPLEDVLGLVATSRRTGVLHAEGPAGSASIWFHKGRMIQHAGGGTDGREALRSVLEMTVGTFAFESEAIPPESYRAIEVEPILEEWRGGAAVAVPQITSVALVRELPAGGDFLHDVWEVLVGIAEMSVAGSVEVSEAGLGALGGSTGIVDALARRTGLAPAEVVVGIAGLEERGLVVVDPPLVEVVQAAPPVAETPDPPLVEMMAEVAQVVPPSEPVEVPDPPPAYSPDEVLRMPQLVDGAPPIPSPRPGTSGIARELDTGPVQLAGTLAGNAILGPPPPPGPPVPPAPGPPPPLAYEQEGGQVGTPVEDVAGSEDEGEQDLLQWFLSTVHQ